jgi:hypothetical protein
MRHQLKAKSGLLRYVVSRFKLPVWTLCLALALGSCAAPGVKELTRPITESTLAKALVSDDKLTDEHLAYLNKEGVDRVYRRSPAEAVRTLADRLVQQPSSSSRISLAEVCSKTGDNLRSKSPQETVGREL